MKQDDSNKTKIRSLVMPDNHATAKINYDTFRKVRHLAMWLNVHHNVALTTEAQEAIEKVVIEAYETGLRIGRHEPRS